jgi:hypothetical protein
VSGHHIHRKIGVRRFSTYMSRAQQIQRTHTLIHIQKPECIKETAVEKGLNILGPIAVGPSSHFSQKLKSSIISLYRPSSSSTAKREHESLLAFGYHCRSYSRHFQLPRTAQFHQGRINNGRFGIVDPRGIIWRGGGHRFRNGHEKNRIIHHPFSLYAQY